MPANASSNLTAEHHRVTEPAEIDLSFLFQRTLTELSEGKGPP